MDKNKFLIEQMGISQRVIDLMQIAEEKARKAFDDIEAVMEINQLKVLNAFSKNRVSDAHFATTSGYGYDDLGRDTLDRVYADVFGSEDALVRHNFISGTHTLSTALFGVLRPNDTMLSITGKPYDTLEEVIGIRGNDGDGSLKDFGINYQQIELKNDKLDYVSIEEALKANEKIKMIFIQRSKGYLARPTLTIADMAEAVKFLKQIKPNVIVMVDNCYGEFVEAQEPTCVGVDLMAGSLIKNPGGGLAQTGGYIAGRADLIEKCAYRLTSVGIGKEAGTSLGSNKSMYQGFFMAPHVVGQALKAAIFCASIFEELGYKVNPSSQEKRSDIIQSVHFKEEKELILFCQGIQKGAPVDSFVTPEPWEMPGYSDKVIMASGAFVQGSSIELSADAPIKLPYIAFMQGGLTYESAKYGIMKATDLVLTNKN